MIFSIVIIRAGLAAERQATMMSTTAPRIPLPPGNSRTETTNGSFTTSAEQWPSSKAGTYAMHESSEWTVNSSAA